MIRRLFTLLSAAWLALCVAAAVLWARAGENTDEWDWPTGGGAVPKYGIRSARAGVEVWLGMDPWTLMDSADPYEPPAGHAWPLGVRTNWSWSDGQFAWHPKGVRAPHLLLVAATALWPGLWLVRGLCGRMARRRRRRTGHCPVCGYDLRATLERCPECGAAAKRATRTEPLPKPLGS